MRRASGVERWEGIEIADRQVDDDGGVVLLESHGQQPSLRHETVRGHQPSQAAKSTSTNTFGGY